MTGSINVSYSATSRFKQCPTKYYLSKKYQDRRISSALPFGKAIEMGVTDLLTGKPLETAQDTFWKHWHQEHIKDNEYRQIFDNLDLQFYASDFDSNLVNAALASELDGWATELLDSPKESWVWEQSFDDINSALKDNREISDAELAFYNRVIWSCCLVRGNVMLQAFHDQILPQVDLTKTEHFAAQKEVSMSNVEGDKIVGYIDYVLFLKEHGWVILDLKTAGAPYNFHKIDTSEQLRTYVAALGGEIGSSKAGYAVLLKKIKSQRICDKCGNSKQGLAKKCKKSGCDGDYTKSLLTGDTQLLIKDFQESELENVLDDYMNVARAIKNEVNYRNTESCFSFGRQCEFYQTCWRNKKPEELDHLEPKEKQG